MIYSGISNNIQNWFKL